MQPPRMFVNPIAAPIRQQDQSKELPPKDRARIKESALPKKKRILPLFPLPEVVLFPGSPLPLHIFEPRYRLMVNTVMASDKLFGVLLYDPQSSQAASVGS